MTPHQRHLPRKQKRWSMPRFFYRWHRRIGASAALFVVWIVCSGWLLNHSDSLGLAQHEIQSHALARWYNLNYQAPTKILSSGNHWLAAINDKLVIDGKKSVAFSEPLGFVQSNTLWAIANAHYIILVDDNGELIDKLDSTNLPLASISKIGTGCSGIVITDTNQIFSSPDGIDWQPCQDIISWSAPQPISDSQLSQLEPMLIPKISLEKIVLDLHTGRFFGRFGALFVDIIGGCLLLLALSGLWLFFRRK